MANNDPTKKFKCPRCGIAKPRTTEFWYWRNNGKWNTPCRECESERRKQYRSWQKRNAPLNDGLLTNKKEREEDGYKCLALDVLTLAVLDYKRGQCELAFFDSWEYNLFCEMAGVHPEWIRRSVV